MLTKLGKYEIRRELGRGAMGVVYEGFDPFIERVVAIKTVQKSLIDQSDGLDALSRFRREAQAAGRLTHPNIVAVYEYGEEDDMAFIAMEFILGKELKSFFDKGERFQINDCVPIMVQLLDALDYSHERGVVHRDIKPSNIIITQGNQIKVVDFGIARIESSELTQVNMVLGTPAYMSPEQFRCLVADRRSDIYSTGVLLYQFLTGARPFNGNPTTLMHKVLCQAPVRPSEINPKVSKALEGVVAKAMAKEPDERYQTAAEFRQALIKATELNALHITQKVTDKTPSATFQMQQISQPDANDTENVINFDLAALNTNIEKQLEEVRRNAAIGTISRSLPEYDPALSALTSIVPKPNPATSHSIQGYERESKLLASLAEEAEVKPGLTGSMSQGLNESSEGDSKAKRLHETLGAISKFFDSFAQQIKQNDPTIARAYTFGRRTVYSNLTCRNAHADSRRLALSDSAFLDYVLLSYRLCAPEPVNISRPRDMLDGLNEQLDKAKLRSLDDIEALSKGKPEDWVQVRLAPDFPVQLQFKGNYKEHKIDVQTLNLESFGTSSFTLDVEAVTLVLLDEIGFFLLGLANKLPEALRLN